MTHTDTPCLVIMFYSQSFWFQEGNRLNAKFLSLPELWFWFQVMPTLIAMWIYSFAYPEGKNRRL